MKRTVFTRFYEAVRTAGNNDPVWYAGYLWIDLTEKQSERIRTALAVNENVHVSIDLGKGVTSYRLPCGLVLNYTE